MSIPNVMRAAVLTGHGGPEMLVVRDDVPVPAPAPGEVLVEVGACGVNNTDIWVREGAYGTEDEPNAVATRRGDTPMQFPRIQGADIAGRVVAVGAEVDEARVGERVMVDFGLYADDSDSLANVDYIGHARDGGFAQYVAVPARNAHAVATDLSYVELATFCCAYVTAHHMLRRAQVTHAETVLISGASGGVGSALVQLTRALGAVPFGLVSSGKEEAVVAIGAEAGISRDSEDFRDAVRTALGPRRVDVVADLVAGPLFRYLLSLLRPEGRYVCAGAIAGPVVEFDLRTLYMKQLDLIGCTQGTRHDFAKVRDLALSGKIKPLVADTYPLSEIHRAQADFVDKRFVGKLVVVPDGATA